MPKMLLNFLAVGTAGALGAMLRYAIGLAFAGVKFPFGTLIINLSGSLLLGWFLASIADRVDFNETWRVAIAVGFIGTYTTFSTFMYESDLMLRPGGSGWITASGYIAGSIFLGLLAVRAGVWIAGK